MSKPEKIKNSVWKQHTTWMNIMKEGSLTGVRIKRDKSRISSK